MKKLLIIGASGFGREVLWLVERINQKCKEWDILGFVDDNSEIHNTYINGYPVIGGCDVLKDYQDAYVVCAVGATRVRKKIVDKVKDITPNIKFATLIDPGVEISEFVSIGVGTIICAHTIVTVNINIGKHVIINLDCTVGHDAILKDFVTLYPSVNVSGATCIGYCSEIGTGVQIIQGRTVGDYAIVGAGAVIVKDIPEKCTAVGSPARPIKFFE